MDKRYQVFVSSTYEDLQEERRDVMQVLLKMNCIPTGMELFPAADDDSLTLIRRFIAECDYYIVLVAGRYGSVDARGKSYTETEYDFAAEAGIPTLPFLHGDPASIPAGRSEATDQGKASLLAFRGKIESARHAKYWTSPKELAGEVALAMMSIMKLKPRTGWVRADLIPDEGAAQEMLKLKNRIEDLEKKLAEASAAPPSGTEELAQGDECIQLTFSFLDGHGWGEQSFSFTWNELLLLMGPILLTAGTEGQLKGKLQHYLIHRVKDNGGADLTSVTVRDEDFQRVKVQFCALCLIEQRDKAIWSLTSYGETVLMKVGAIRSRKATKPDL
jgi:hypothetical protein